MTLYISAAEYDYHTLVKVAEMAGLHGIIGFHETEDGYLLSFPDGEETPTLMNLLFNSIYLLSFFQSRFILFVIPHNTFVYLNKKTVHTTIKIIMHTVLTNQP